MSARLVRRGAGAYTVQLAIALRVYPSSADHTRHSGGMREDAEVGRRGEAHRARQRDSVRKISPVMLRVLFVIDGP